eukprot:TRINITY_DN67_c0_g1_i3.p1 TRINITY_DN67_c0_g1~~TRINITY_DN67_c0_g1_i3.p1  ORF type:complete len:337 (-),score=89.22 TRINITY_DN67_c0_g1_i3:294-1304(-)
MVSSYAGVGYLGTHGVETSAPPVAAAASALQPPQSSTSPSGSITALIDAFATAFRAAAAGQKEAPPVTLHATAPPSPTRSVDSASSDSSGNITVAVSDEDQASASHSVTASKNLHVRFIDASLEAGSSLQSIKYSLYVSYTSSRQYVLYKTHNELAQLITKLHSRGALGADFRLPEVRLTLPELQQTGVAAGCRCASALVPHGRGRGGIPTLYSLQGCTCSGGRAWQQQQEQQQAPAGCFGGATRAQHCLTQTLEEVETFVCALLSTQCGSSAGQHAAQQQQQQLRDHPLVQAFFWLPTSPSGSLLVVEEEEDDSDDWQAQGPAWAQDGVEWSYGA